PREGSSSRGPGRRVIRSHFRVLLSQKPAKENAANRPLGLYGRRTIRSAAARGDLDSASAVQLPARLDRCRRPSLSSTGRIRLRAALGKPSPAPPNRDRNRRASVREARRPATVLVAFPRYLRKAATSRARLREQGMAVRSAQDGGSDARD